MRFLPSGGHGSEYLPKLLGSYELEIQPALGCLLARRWDAIINIGAGEGYYACGCARRHPQIPVFAFEAVAAEHGLIADLAARNGAADRVTVAGACRPEDLAALLERHPRSLVIMDVEGAEAELLAGPVPTRCRQAALIVELHEAAAPGIGDRLAAAFAASHRLESVWSRPRTVWDAPYPVLPLRLYLRHHLLKHMEEWRGGRMRWLVMCPRWEAAGQPV